MPKILDEEALKEISCCQGTAIPNDVFIFPMKESGAVPSRT